MKFMSIKEQGGLQVYLDRPDQVQRHNGLGYDMWHTFRIAGTSKTLIAKRFNVSRVTVGEWIKIDQELT